VLVDTLLVFSQVAEKALMLDFSGAKAAWAAGTKGIADEVNANLGKIKLDKNTLSVDWSAMKAAWKEGDDEIEAIDKQFLKTVEKNREDAAAAFQAVNENLFGQRTATAKPPPGNTSDGGAGKNKDIMAQWEAELAQDKLGYEQKMLAQGSFQEFSKAQELEFWNAKLATHEAKGAQEFALEKKVADLKLAINKQAFDTELAGLKEREAEFSKSADARVALAKVEAQKIGTAYGTISPQYEAALKHVTEMERQAFEQQRAVAELYQKADQERQVVAIASDEKGLETQLANHLISSGKFIQEADALENARTAILKAGIEKRIAAAKSDPTASPTELATLNVALENLETEHQAKLVAIQQKATAQMQQLQKQEMTLVQDQFASTITSMMKGTETFGQGMKKMLQDMIVDVVSFLTKWAIQWAETQLLNLVSAKTTNVQAAVGQAAVAGAAGVASFAGAPWPIDMGAPAFGAAMYAEALGYSAAASAMGGYDIPAGVSPMTQLHAREMVLPEDIANGMRTMIASGSSRGGGNTNHLHVSAVDAHGVERLFRNNPTQITKALQRLHSTGHKLR
jgi:hypothetical protein